MCLYKAGKWLVEAVDGEVLCTVQSKQTVAVVFVCIVKR